VPAESSERPRQSVPSKAHPSCCPGGCRVEIEGGDRALALAASITRKKRTSGLPGSALPHRRAHRSGCRTDGRRGQRRAIEHPGQREPGPQASLSRSKRSLRNTSAQNGRIPRAGKSLASGCAVFGGAGLKVGQLGLGDRQGRRTQVFKQGLHCFHRAGHFFERLRSAQWGKPKGAGLLTAEAEDAA